MNGRAVLICIVFVLILQLVVIIVARRSRRRDNYTLQRVPRVLVLVISSANQKYNSEDGEKIEINSDNDRWEVEKEYWNDRITRYRNICKNIDWKLISCKPGEGGENELLLDCVESYIPGILQKTISSISQNLESYDFFVRTNLSTCIDCKKLVRMINGVNNDHLVYTGGRRLEKDGTTYISGTSIMLNKTAASLLVSRYNKNKQMYDDLYEFDDVVIGKIMKNKVTMMEKYGMFDADPMKSSAKNIDDYKNLLTPFFRTKTMTFRRENKNRSSMKELFELFNQYLMQDLDKDK